MSLRGTVRAFPTLLRIGFSEAVAYRAEMLVWMLATTMPLVMMALWTAVAADGPVGRYGKSEFVAYFLATFIVRQITGTWVFYEINYEVRQGTLSMRLLRPIHPLWAWAAEALAAMPIRLVVALPLACIAIYLSGTRSATHDPLLWAIWVLSIAGAWLLTLSVNLSMGSLSFFTESSMKVMDVWIVFFFVLSGYLVPVDLFPPGLRAIVNWLPFRYQIGFPVELMTGALSRTEALRLLACQWMWVAAGFFATRELWRRGVRRYAAYGG